MAGWRVGMVVGNARICAALARVKSYLDYGAFTPIQVAAIGGAERAAGLRGRHPRHLQGRAGTCLIKSMGRKPAGTIPAPARLHVRLGAAAGQVPQPGLDGVRQAPDRAGGIAVAPGLGFGEYGEGYVRIGLVENEHRIRQAARAVKKFLSEADAAASAS